VGQVWRQHTHFFYVRLANNTHDSLIETQAKATIKKEGDRIYVGDWVLIDHYDEANNTARIIQRLPRQRLLEKTRVTNVEGCLVVCPIKQPDFDMAHVQRLLVLARLSGMQPVVVFTKADLASAEELQSVKIAQEGLAQHSLVTSSVLGLHTPLAEVQAWASDLEQRYPLWVLAGVSGAGKSTLINRLNPNVQLKTATVSDKLERGRHTTRHSELIRIYNTLFLADCPGFSQLQLPLMNPMELIHALPELANLAQQCGLGLQCEHTHEADCAVKPACEQSPWLHTVYDVYRELWQLLDEPWQVQKERSQKLNDAEGSKKHLSTGKANEQKSVIRLNARHRERSRKTENQRLKSWQADSADSADTDI
jgi:ribosome biogenesis GTPase